MNIVSKNFMFPAVTTSNVGLLEYWVTNTSISQILWKKEALLLQSYSRCTECSLILH